MSVGELNLDWLDETINHIEKPSFPYKVARFFLRRELTYKDLYLVGIGLRRKLDDDDARKESLESVLTKYKRDKGNVPEGWEEYVSDKENKD